MSDWNEDHRAEDLDIAIIGMEGRFPGAGTIEEFWVNLHDGVESIRFFTDDELKKFGADPVALAHTNFIKAGAVLEGVDLFDASFFGYSPSEAEMMDPQQRIFLECAWQALERAGYNPETYDGLIGVYAGASLSTYLLLNLMTHPIQPEDSFQVMIENDKDFLSTHVSYKLNLKGPSLSVQTACSTSLVAIHLACQSLLSYQCDIVLAGGVSIQVPQRIGYYYQVGGINSPDGHCRAFDAKAQGTIFGSGVGVVVLKRLAEAIKDGDTIQAVIKASAINNDGSSKIGYTAPSVEGQTQVISMAHLISGVGPESITYVEAHGTATALGDPVEVEALTNAFRGRTQKRGFCAIGSVKTNIGHLDAAAGVAGLIKTVLALRHRQLPPSLHFTQPNPNIDFGQTPFYVNAELKAWESDNGPLRAGVSAFGVGGTNAHLILEQAPETEAGGPSRPWQLLLLSARSENALEQATENLARRLEQTPERELADVAYTLAVGRKGFDYRRMVVCREVSEAVAGCSGQERRWVWDARREVGHRPVVFLFPGGGSQYPGMAQGVYQEERVFREQVDFCADILRSQFGHDPRDFLYPVEERREEAVRRLKQTSIALPALFVIEYALAKLWMSWGVRPEAMIGHSLGEYVAACLAGVFSLEDALSLVVMRGRLLEQLPSGSMLSIPLSEDEALPLIDDRLSIAAINGPAQCVLSGPTGAIDDVVARLRERGEEFRRIQIDTASHSPMVAPILGAFTSFIEKIHLHAPKIPYISNVTGTWVTAEATEPGYWAKHLRQTVRFGDGIKELLMGANRVFLEVGPGHTLSALAKLQTDNSRGQDIISSIRHPYDPQPDMASLLTALGKLWACGVEVDWEKYYSGQRRRRVDLPTYPFERRRYWIEAAAAGAGSRPAESDGKRGEISQWFYEPSWRRKRLSGGARPEAGDGRAWMICDEGLGLGRELERRLVSEGARVILVRMAEEYVKEGSGCYGLNPSRRSDYERLLGECKREGASIGRVIHLWSLRGRDAEKVGEIERFRRAQEVGYYSLLWLGQELSREGREGRGGEVEVVAVTRGMQKVESGDEGRAEDATMLGVCKVLGQEQEQVFCRSVDLSEEEKLEEEAGYIVEEVMKGREEREVAYRGELRWVRRYEKLSLEGEEKPERRLREGGVYLITGGLGGVGLMLAKYLAAEVKARVVLIGRSQFPDKERWSEWILERGIEDETSRKIRQLEEIEHVGGEVMIIQADVSQKDEMGRALAKVDKQYGALNGVIHAAGVTGQKALRLINDLSYHECELQFQAKVYGLYALESALRGRDLDFCLLFSSNASILGGPGLVSYTAANLFMDAFAVNRSRDNRWISANWDGWPQQREDDSSGSFRTSLDQYAMTCEEGIAAFKRVVTLATNNQVIISTGDLARRIDLWIRPGALMAGTELKQGESSAAHPRPSLETKYVPPSDELQSAIAKIWQEMLRIERLGIEDNFFDLGGNSLIGLKIISRLKRELDIDIPVVALFEGPTVRGLASVIIRGRNEAPSYEESRSRGERRRERKLRNR